MHRNWMLRLGWGAALLCMLAQPRYLSGLPLEGEGQVAAASQSSSSSASLEQLRPWEGHTVRSIGFEGVSAERLAPLPGKLQQQPGQPLRLESLRDSLRRLYATGLYDSIAVYGTEIENGNVAIVFRGQARAFIGRVSVDGAKGTQMNTRLERASRLEVGTRYSETKLQHAEKLMQQTLADNGYHDATITHKLTPHPEDQLMDIAFQVISNVQARAGQVVVTGDSGLTTEQFRRKAKLRENSHVDRDTSSRAIDGLIKNYRKQDRLEADIKIESQKYDPTRHMMDYSFAVSRGPVVHVLVHGAKIGNGRIKRLIPVFEEGSVDEDLLNEGSRRLRDYFQTLGYFNVKVSHNSTSDTTAASSTVVEIIYTVDLGAVHRVVSVKVDGNKYFDAATLAERLSVRPADPIDRHGVYSQSLVASDVDALTAIYQNNGFSHVKITPEVTDGNRTGIQKQLPLGVIYHIDEGMQQRVGVTRIIGAGKIPTGTLVGMMNTVSGQLLSPQNVAGDRDELLTYYLSRGFADAKVEVSEQTETGNANIVNVTFQITEGEQTFVRKVLVRGLHFTRFDTVNPGITLHPLDPLDQSAMLETQRNFYDLALFNEVNAAVENPNGAEERKTVIMQTMEARRWDLSYGLGFEAQTGNPQNNCTNTGLTGCTPNGKTGISPRVIFDVTRINLFGRDQSLSLRSTYGLLEESVNLSYQNPHLMGSHNFGFTVLGGYSESQSVVTYAASKLEGDLRITQHFLTPGEWLSKANTFIYEFDFRRIKVNTNSILVAPDEIPLLSAPVKVGGPGFTWIRDTRDVALDAHRGTYTSFQEFLANSKFGSETDFNRVDITNSSYYSFKNSSLVLARSTRFGYERSFGAGSQEEIPLPERLYAGGATSHRGFGVNAAGPRDSTTGYPIGGPGAFVNSTELRMPPPALPLVGKSLSFVLFHDAGNVFAKSSQIWPSMFRAHQTSRATCNIQDDTCNFNYFSHAIGLGVRYHTPVGPVRLDFSYNLNPPVFPVLYDYSQVNGGTPRMDRAPHFNFFFSFGQTF